MNGRLERTGTDKGETDFLFQAVVASHVISARSASFLSLLVCFQLLLSAVASASKCWWCYRLGASSSPLQPQKYLVPPIPVHTVPIPLATIAEAPSLTAREQPPRPPPQPPVGVSSGQSVSLVVTPPPPRFRSCAFSP